MNKVCFWTQTYKNDRKELFDYHKFDKFDIQLRNHFHNIFSFHNCDSEYIDEIVNSEYLESIKDKEIVRFDLISYTECVRKILTKLKDEGYEYLIFCQDDSYFSFSDSDKPSDFDIQKLVDIFKYQKIEMLNLEYSIKDLKNLEECEFNKIHQTTSTDFEKAGFWPFDDATYFANIDFLIERLYDENYYTKSSVWDGENYLAEKWKGSENPRFSLSSSIYKRFNFTGRNKNLEERTKLDTMFKVPNKNVITFKGRKISFSADVKKEDIDKELSQFYDLITSDIDVSENENLKKYIMSINIEQYGKIISFLYQMKLSNLINHMELLFSLK
jgi:hypothetical protein